MKDQSRFAVYAGKGKPKPGRSPVVVDNYEFTPHARMRMAQRGLSVEDVRYVLRYGTLMYAGAAVVFFLGKMDIPKPDRRQYERLDGVAVVTSYEGWVITVWRNRKSGSRHIRSKIDSGRCGLPHWPPHSRRAGIN